MGTSDSTLTALCQMPMQGVATVLARDDASGLFMLSGAPDAMQARLAPSCLLQPGVGDKVWWVGSVGEGFFLTAVLCREGASAVVQLPADATIKSDQGRMRIEAKTLAMSADVLLMEADEAAVQIKKVAAVTTSLSWTGSMFKLTADLIESFSERVVQFSRWSQRMVDGPDMVRSRQIDYRAEQLMQLQAQNLIANAENLFKADGEQIHLG